MWIQIPTPGDHYSPAYGSALITIIYEISKIHEMNGGKTRVIVGKGTKHDHDCGEIVEVDFPPELSRNQKIVDYGLGKIGLNRLFGPRQYAPALNAIPKDFDGIVFVHNNPVALRLLKKERPKSKVCLWANNELWRHYTQAEIRKIESATDYLVCCSQYIADDLNEKLGFVSSKVRVARSGVNTESFTPATILPDSGVPVITFIGRIIEEKGPHLLMEAAQRLGNRSFKIRIVGSRQFDAKDPLSDYEKRLRQLAEPLGDKVEFVPAVDRFRVVEEYQKSDIFCSPAIWNEPLGLTILESLSCGLPTITTRRGGIPEIGGEAALYFNPDNVDELVSLLADLLDNPEKRKEIGRESRLHAETLSWKHQYEELLMALR